MEAKYYKEHKPFWDSFYKIDAEYKFEICVNTHGNIELIQHPCIIKPEYQESSRSEFEMSKLKLSNYIETL
jgi:hypothetical protein